MDVEGVLIGKGGAIGRGGCLSHGFALRGWLGTSGVT